MSTLIQNIPLYLNGSKEVTADLYKGLSMQAIECWKKEWEPAFSDYLKRGKKRPEHAHWDWLAKATVAVMSQKDDLIFWISYKSIMQGIMIVDKGHAYHEDDAGKENIYIQFLEVAPWNFYKDKQVGYYKGVGSILLMAAINYSNSLGYEGRIALESLPQSEGFYAKYEMIVVNKEHNSSPLKYLELPTYNAMKLVRGM